MMYLISEDLANRVLNYLAAQPYREVFEMVESLRQLTPSPKSEATEPARQILQETESHKC